MLTGLCEKLKVESYLICNTPLVFQQMNKCVAGEVDGC